LPSGGGRERGSEDWRWREVGDATSVRCGEVMANHAGWGLGCCANKNEVCRRDLDAHPKLGALIEACWSVVFSLSAYI